VKGRRGRKEEGKEAYKLCRGGLESCFHGLASFAVAAMFGAPPPPSPSPPSPTQGGRGGGGGGGATPLHWRVEGEDGHERAKRVSRSI